MAYLITVKKFAQIMSVSRQAIYEKIKRKIIPEEVVIEIPSIKTKMVRIDIELLAELKTEFKNILIEKNITFKRKEINNFIKVTHLASIFNVTVDYIYKGIDSGIYPIIDISGGDKGEKKRAIRILKKETADRYPNLKRILDEI